MDIKSREAAATMNRISQVIWVVTELILLRSYSRRYSVRSLDMKESCAMGRGRFGVAVLGLVS
jgi:hypothetical protein